MICPAAQLSDVSVDIAVRRGVAAPVVRVLDEVDLTVPAGAVTALIGESGCGKSLVAAALCGLLPPGSRLTGRLEIDGADFSDADERAWRPVRGRRIGYVPQSAITSFTPVRTIGAQLREICDRLHADRGPAELLAAVQLSSDVAELYPHELSGGMAQRAAIAAAVAGRPGLLIADEPTSALDPGHAALIWRLLGQVADDGAGVLVVTHDVASLLAAEICGEVAVMRAGHVEVQAPLDELRTAADGYVERFFDCVVL